MPTYDVPAAGSGGGGLEGFSVAGASERLGRVAALNRTREGIVLVVDTGDVYRVVPTGAVARIETRAQIVRLSAAGEQALEAAPPAETRVVRTDSPALVRYVPTELDRLLVEGDPPPPRKRTGLWIAGATLILVGLVGIFVGATVTAEANARPVVWLWLLVPLAVLVAGCALLWRAMGTDSEGRQLTRREKASDALTFLLGVSPRTRRRG
jgi:hypothetical protein